MISLKNKIRNKCHNFLFYFIYLFNNVTIENKLWNNWNSGELKTVLLIVIIIPVLVFHAYVGSKNILS